jgi:CubicO group peptidase (beta-lactamase class C family)
VAFGKWSASQQQRLPMLLRSLVVSIALAMTACGGGQPTPTPPAASPSVQESADEAVSNGLVGVSFTRLDGDTATQGTAGMRRVDATDPIQVGDDFMIGSTTKAMTAALAGSLVKQGRIAWTTTLAEALPSLAAGMRPAYRSVTLEELLDHRGGVLAFEIGDELDRFQTYVQTFKGTLPDTLAGRERFFAAWVLAQDPPAGITPGQDFLYSNAGYALAALMLEASAGRAFDELIQKELAEPLGMTVTWTSSADVLTNRPVGHAGAKGSLAPVVPEAPDIAVWREVTRAGGAGLTLTANSYATWVRWHLRALRGEGTPLADGYVQRIKALQEGGYAMGWYGTLLNHRAAITHSGEYRGFSSIVAIDQQGRSATFALTNTFADDGKWVLQLLNKLLIDVDHALPPK